MHDAVEAGTGFSSLRQQAKMNGGEKQKAFSMQGNGATYATGADSVPTAPVTLVPTGVEPGQGADEGVVKMEVAETEEEKRKREKREKKERRKSEKLAAAGAGEGEVKADGDVSPKKEKKEKKEKVSVFSLPRLVYGRSRLGTVPFKLWTLTLPCGPPPPLNRNAPETTTLNLRKRKSRRRRSRLKTTPFPAFSRPGVARPRDASLYHLYHTGCLLCPIAPRPLCSLYDFTHAHHSSSVARGVYFYSFPFPSQSGPSLCYRELSCAGFCLPACLERSKLSRLFRFPIPTSHLTAAPYSPRVVPSVPSLSAYQRVLRKRLLCTDVGSYVYVILIWAESLWDQARKGTSGQTRPVWEFLTTQSCPGRQQQGRLPPASCPSPSPSPCRTAWHLRLEPAAGLRPTFERRPREAASLCLLRA